LGAELPLVVDVTAHQSSQLGELAHAPSGASTFLAMSLELVGTYA
jgi:hypothetical protein